MNPSKFAMNKIINNTQISNLYIQKLIKSNSIFIHIPKTAGVSLKTALYGIKGTYHYSFNNYENILHQKFIEKAFKFTFCRNPYTRLISAYNYLKKGGGNEIDKTFYEIHIKKYNNFDDFVNHGLINDRILQKFIHFKTQKSFLLNHKNKIEIDFIGKLENISNDYQYVCSKLNINSELPTLNKSTSDIVKLKPETRTNIFNYYEDDFQLFNYGWI